MLIRRIAGCTAVLGAPEGWDPATDGRCVGLPVRITQHDMATPNFESAWEPTAEELVALNAGASVILRCVGGQPPVMLYVDGVSHG